MANPTQVFRRNSAWYKGVIRSLATDVIVHGHVETTEARAKEVRRHVDKLITKAKRNTLASRRSAEAFLRGSLTRDGVSVGKYLFDTLGPQYAKRDGGYTRLIKSPSREGDNTRMAIIELV